MPTPTESASFDWPDSIQAYAWVGQHRGRLCWAIATDDAVLQAGAMPDTAQMLDAQLSMMTAVQAHPSLSGLGVDLAVNDRRLRAALNELRHLWPSIEPLPAGRVSADCSGLTAARDAAVEAAEASGPVYTYAGTDGARDRKTPRGGFGWVTADGRHGSGPALVPNALAAELRAIAELLDAIDDDPLAVLVDSDVARSMARRALSGQPVSTTDAISSELTRIARHAGREVRLCNVAGHTGVPLNEGAHRLAVLARREGHAPIAGDVLASKQAAIVSETVDCYRSVELAAVS